MQIEPYLFFNGRCDEAIEFYVRTLGAEVAARMSYRDSPRPNPPGMVPPGCEDKVMHALLRIGPSNVMLSDGRCEGETSFQGFSLSLAVPTEADAQRLFAALSDGGQVGMPLAKTFFSPAFGMLTDRFGVPWMVIVS